MIAYSLASKTVSFHILVSSARPEDAPTALRKNVDVMNIVVH